MKYTGSLKIRIGHSAYRGTNALAFATSKTQAVAILRDRGMTRDDARELVNKVMQSYMEHPHIGGYGSGSVRMVTRDGEVFDGDPIEFEFVGTSEVNNRWPSHLN